MEEKNPALVTRNHFLKILVAAGGAITASAFLPDKWIKPLVNVGVIPAHAQTSGLSIVGGSFTVTLLEGFESSKGRGLASLKKSNNPSYSTGAFVFIDTAGAVDSSATIDLKVKNPQTSDYDFICTGASIASLTGSITSLSATSGRIEFRIPNFNVSTYLDHVTFTITFMVRMSVGGMTSNWDTYVYNNPI
jgi:hypothetical protein